MVKPGETQESQTYVNRTLVFLYAGTLIRRISAYFLFLPSTRQQFSDILVAWSLFSLDMHACFFLGVGLFCFFTAPGCSYGCPCTLVVNAHSFSMCYLIYSWLVVVLGVGVVGLLANFPQLELLIRWRFTVKLSKKTPLAHSPCNKEIIEAHYLNDCVFACLQMRRVSTSCRKSPRRRLQWPVQTRFVSTSRISH